MPESHDHSAPKDRDTNTPSGTAAQGEERHGGSDADVNFPSNLGSDLTSGTETGNAVTGQHLIPRNERTAGDSTVGTPVDEASDTTAR